MRSRPGGASAGRAFAAALVLLAAGCGHLPAMPAVHWPWHARPAPAPAPVHELDISGAAGDPGSFPQYWKRNTLVVDLTAASGSGSLTLRPADGTVWPVRLAFRVRPGSIGVLEVRADQRLNLPITPAAGKPVDLELTPRMYTSRTRQMTVTWGPISSPAS
jgi:hypothetical protein